LNGFRSTIPIGDCTFPLAHDHDWHAFGGLSNRSKERDSDDERDFSKRSESHLERVVALKVDWKKGQSLIRQHRKDAPT